MQFVEANGARIPQIGLGTMTLKEDVCVQAVKTALLAGYRHLDTAEYYGNEVENGAGLRASAVNREDVFICTKVRTTTRRIWPPFILSMSIDSRAAMKTALPGAVSQAKLKSAFSGSVFLPASWRRWSRLDSSCSVGMGINRNSCYCVPGTRRG